MFCFARPRHRLSDVTLVMKRTGRQHRSLWLSLTALPTDCLPLHLLQRDKLTARLECRPGR